MVLSATLLSTMTNYSYLNPRKRGNVLTASHYKWHAPSHRAVINVSSKGEEFISQHLKKPRKRRWTHLDRGKINAISHMTFSKAFSCIHRTRHFRWKWQCATETPPLNTPHDWRCCRQAMTPLRCSSIDTLCFPKKNPARALSPPGVGATAILATDTGLTPTQWVTKVK